MLRMWLQQIKGRLAAHKGLQRLFRQVQSVDQPGEFRTVRLPSEKGIRCSCGDTDRGCAIGGCYARVHEQGLFDPERKVRCLQIEADYIRRMAAVRAEYRRSRAG